MFQGGELVAVVRGANAPLLEKTIREQLEAEKKVLAEGRERRVVSGQASRSLPCPTSVLFIPGKLQEMPVCSGEVQGPLGSL